MIWFVELLLTSTTTSQAERGRMQLKQVVGDPNPLTTRSMLGQTVQPLFEGTCGNTGPMRYS